MGSLRHQLAGLKAPKFTDFDPESVEDANEQSDGSADEELGIGGEKTQFTGQEHYEEVGTSKLRRPERVELGEGYQGSKVKRSDLFGSRDRTGTGQDQDKDADEDVLAPVEESDNDPFAKPRDVDSQEDDSDLDDGSVVDGEEPRIITGPIPVDEDEEIDSDEAFGEGDEERFKQFKFLGSRHENGVTDAAEFSGFDSESLSEDDSDAQLGDEVSSKSGSEDLDMQDVSDLSQDESGSDFSNDSATLPSKIPPKSSTQDNRARLKALLSSTKSVPSSLSLALSVDAKKGRAVKIQQQTYDRIIDARIKMQKGLVAANLISRDADEDTNGSAAMNPDADQQAIRKAEEAALGLWNTITAMRHTLAGAQTQETTSSVDEKSQNKKRKRAPPAPATLETTLSTIFSLSNPPNESKSTSSNTNPPLSMTLPHHRATIAKWSAKIRASNPVTKEPRSNLLSQNKKGSTSEILDVIDTYIQTEKEKQHLHPSIIHNTPDRKANTPNLARWATYTDDTFYQSLLRDLIASRGHTATINLSTTTNNISSILPTSSSLQPTARTHKRMHTKSSKGRRVRYGVHEKLRDFMVAEGGVDDDDVDGDGDGEQGRGDEDRFDGVNGHSNGSRNDLRSYGSTMGNGTSGLRLKEDGMWSSQAREEFFRGLLGAAQNWTRNGTRIQSQSQSQSQSHGGERREGLKGIDSVEAGDAMEGGSGKVDDDDDDNDDDGIEIGLDEARGGFRLFA